MRKIMISVIAMMMVVGLMVSCDNANISPELKAEELVSVSFDEGASRGLTGSIEAFSKGNYYWKYAAQKADTSGLISGQTRSYDEEGADWINKDADGNCSGPSLGTVSGFSQGYWNFKLFAYTYTDEEGYNLAYTGEITGQLLQKDVSNNVMVTVAPIASGNGTLKVDTAHISFVPKQNSALTAEQLASFAKVVTVQKWENNAVTGSPETNPEPVDGALTYNNLSAGTYRVTVGFVRNDGIKYTEGYAIATVYSNVTTIVSGYLDEFTTNADFDSDAEVINKVAIFTLENVSDIDASITGNVTLVETSEESNRKVEAVVMKDDAKKQLSDAVNNSVYKDVEAERTAELQLKVDTTSATENTVTLEIGMSSVVTTKISSSEGSDSVVYTETSAIKSLKDYVTVKVQMQKYLSNVAVTHNGHDMVSSESTTADQGYGVYSYDRDEGLLIIKTKSFSPFEVSYDPFIAQIGLIKYSSIQDAIDAAPAGEQTTIKLLTDVRNGGGFGFWNDNENRKDKNIILDLNYFTYTFEGPAVGSKGFESQAMHLEKDNTLYIKNGKLDIVEGNTAIKMLIQNYCNLTLDSVEVDGSNLNGKYTLSNNCGNVTITGTTILRAPEDGVAFDVYYWAKYYPEGVSVTLDRGFTGYIYGDIEYYADEIGINLGDVASKAKLTILAGYNQGTINNEIRLGSSIDETNTGITISGGIFKYQPNPNFMAFPYTTSLNSYNYYLVYGDRAKIENEIQTKGCIQFNGDININGAAPGFGTSKSGFILDGGVVDGKNYSLNVYDANNTNDCAIFVKKGTIKNLKIKNGFRGIYMEQPTGDILIDNVVIDGNCVYTLNQNCTKSDYSVTVQNSTLNGWTSHSEAKLFKYVNCSFGEGGPWWGRYAYFRPYGNTIVENCNFSEGFKVDSSEISNTEYLKFIDCRVGETLITQENVTTLLGADAGKITVENTISID